MDRKKRMLGDNGGRNLTGRHHTERNITGRNVTAFQICLVAMAVCTNLVGGQIALLLRLPIYLDSIGTILIGALLGPFYGMLPNLLSGVIMGMTVDIYSLYFAPVGMITGFLSGLVFQNGFCKKNFCRRGLLAALFVTVPGTIVSSVICAVLVGGITSSGSTILVQLLAKTPLGMTASVFAVQILTDYLDRAISLFAVVSLLAVLPEELKRRLKGKAAFEGRAAV